MHAPFHPNGRAPSPVVSTRRGFLGRCAGLATWASPGLGAGLLAGCGGGSDSSAYLRFCHTGVDDGTADFWVAGSRVVASLANGGTVSSWLQGDAGSVALAWHAAGSSSARLTETRSLTEDSHTSVVAWGTLASSLKFRYLAETNSAAASGSVKLRGFHAAPSIGAVDVFVTNSSSLDGLDPTFTLDEPGALGDFVTLDAGTWRIRVTPSGDSSTVLFDHTDGVSLGSTGVITLVLSPRASGSLPNIALLAEKSGSALLDNTLA